MKNPKNRIISLIYSVLRVYWRVFKPITLGVRAIVVNEANEILLVKHTYEDYWFLPGGGVKKSETFEKAIRRELIEEAGYEADIIELFGVYNSVLQGKRDNIVVFICKNGKFVKSSLSPEIATYKFFSIDNSDNLDNLDNLDNFKNLPENISRGTLKRIEEYCDLSISKRFGVW